MLRPVTYVSSSPLTTALSSRQNHVCFKLCIQPNFPEAEASYKSGHSDIYFKTKTVVAHAAKCYPLCHIFRNVEPSAIFFQAFSSVIRSFTGSSSQCFETPTAVMESRDMVSVSTRASRPVFWSLGLGLESRRSRLGLGQELFVSRLCIGYCFWSFARRYSLKKRFF